MLRFKLPTRLVEYVKVDDSEKFDQTIIQFHIILYEQKNQENFVIFNLANLVWWRAVLLVTHQFSF